MPELIWDGKYDQDGRRTAPLRGALPFQTVEMVNETAQQRQLSLASSLSFAKLPQRFGFVIQYTDSAANLRNYEPDFVVTTGDGDSHLVETKGREAIDVAHKDRAARIWCENATLLTGSPGPTSRRRRRNLKSCSPPTSPCWPHRAQIRRRGRSIRRAAGCKTPPYGTSPLLPVWEKRPGDEG